METPDKSVIDYKDNPDVSSDIVKYQKNSDGSFTPIVQKTPLDTLLKEKTILESQIADLEKKYADTPQDRLQTMARLGMDTEVKTLNELKTKLGTIKGNLYALQDKSVEIPIKERQKYKDLGINFTTKDIKKSTFAERQQNVLDKLATSREYSRLGEAISAYQRTIESNQKQIDDFYTAKKEQINFEYKSKVDRLKSVKSAYSDIITWEQKKKMQERNHELKKEFETLKAKLDLDKENARLLNLGGSGSIDVQGYLSGGVNDKKQIILNGISDGSIKKLSGLKQIDKLNELYKEDVAAADALVSKGSTIISAINELLANPKALDSILGFSGVIPGFPGSSKAQAEDNWELIEALATLDKTSYITGAMSDKDLELLRSASSLLSRNKTLSRNTEILINTKMLFEEIMIKANLKKEKSRDSIIDTEKILKEIDTEKILKEIESENIPQVIKQEEGFRNQAYQDIAGIWTIGFGTTAIDGVPVKQGDYISKEEAKKIAKKQISEQYSTFESKINRDLTENQRNALISFEYNLGSKGAWGGSLGKSILADINNGNFKGAGEKMLAFNKFRNPRTGELEFSQSLFNRRKREAQMLLN